MDALSKPFGTLHGVPVVGSDNVNPAACWSG